LEHRLIHQDLNYVLYQFSVYRCHCCCSHLVWHLQIVERNVCCSGPNRTIALFFINIDKFEHFKAGSIEAELRTVVVKAYAAIDDLKELGLSLSAPIVDELAVSGRMFQYIPLEHKLERVEKIAATLKKLGASQAEIDEACSTIYYRVRKEHVQRIIGSLKSSNPDKESLIKDIQESKIDDWNADRIHNFIEENNLIKGEDTDERFLDLEYFLKNKKIRREDKWQS